MIVYIESNFVLELSLEQEQAKSANDILLLAENGKIELAFPAFALAEPFATIAHRERERRRLCSSFSGQLRELQRSKQHQDVVSQLEPAPNLLLEIGKKEFDLLQSTVMRLLKVGKSIGISMIGFQKALAYQDRYGLSPQDSIIYSLVIGDLQRRGLKEAKCFISRNWKDFGDPDIKSELEFYNCAYLEDFTTGLRFIQSTYM
ncbi:MAG: hypothetical protein KKD83_00105 [Chloroflexi bacterium]|nr:hypothetical protein [Chloroflexota bacterium]